MVTNLNSKSFLNDCVFQCLKNYFKVSNEWIVQPETVQKKLHAPLTSPNLAKKRLKENDYLSCEHFVTYLFQNFSHVKKFKGKSNSVSVNFLKTVIGLIAAVVLQKEH